MPGTQDPTGQPLPGRGTHVLAQPARLGAHIDPDATADADRTTLWRDFPERLARLAGSRRRFGDEPRGREAIPALNSDRGHEFYFAVSRAGGLFVPVNTRLAGPQVLH